MYACGKAVHVSRGEGRAFKEIPGTHRRIPSARRRGTTLPPSSYPRGLVVADMADLVTPMIAETLLHGLPILDHRWRGRFLANATLVGPEARGSSPVRIVRDDQTRQSPTIAGIYPVGEGAGYAGGIVSAAVDGLRSAKAVMGRYAPVIAKSSVV